MEKVYFAVKINVRVLATKGMALVGEGIVRFTMQGIGVGKISMQRV